MACTARDDRILLTTPSSLQAERWGAQLNTEDVEAVDLSSRPFTIRGTETTVKAHSVIIATGATAKKLNLPSEQKVGQRPQGGGCSFGREGEMQCEVPAH